MRGEVLHVIRRLRFAVQEAYEAGYLGRDILGSGFDLDIIVHAGAGAYICGEETALLDSLEGYRGQPRLKPPFPAVAGLYACPTVVNNVESIATVPSILATGPLFAASAPRSPRASGSSRCPATSPRPGQYEAPLGTTLRELLELAGGIRAGHRLKFWTAGRLVDAALHRRAPGRAARLRVGGRRRVDARHPVGAALRRDHLRGPGRAPLDRVLRARVLRQVHAVPGGQLWVVQLLERLEHGEGSEADLDKLLDICSNITGRAFCALGDSIEPRSSRHRVLQGRVHRASKSGGCPFDPAASTLWASGSAA